MADLLNIGLSGLRVSQTQLTITGHNISNVNTPGFSRQSATQSTTLPQFSGSGYIGSGVALTDIRRSYSEFLTTQLRNTTSLSSDVEAYKSQISQLDSLLAGSTTGITPSLKSFFAAMQTAAEDPANIPARQLVLSEAEGLARRFNTVYDRLNAQNESLNKQMSAVSDQVNRLAGSIASLNQAIAVAAANGSQPNDLMDAREEAIRQLSTYVGVSVVPQSDGTQSIFIGSGQPLVVGNSANRLEAVPGKGDPNRFEIEFVSGDSRQGVTTLLSGGELGGLVRYRTETLDNAMNSLGRLALAITDQVNTQLGMGLDLKGQAGSPLFADYNDPGLAALRALNLGSNVGNAQPLLNITDTRTLSTSDYRLEITDSTTVPPTFSARRLSDGASMTVTATANPAPGGGYTLSFADPAKAPNGGQGFEVAFSAAELGKAVQGDVFLLQPTRRGATDIGAILDQPDQLALAAPVRAEANTQNRGSGVITQPDLQGMKSPIDPVALTAALPVGLTYDSTTGLFAVPAGATLTRINQDGTPAVPPAFQSGQQNSYELQLSDGSVVRFNLSGRPENGDTFNVAFNDKGVSDNRNGLKLADLQSKATVGIDLNSPGTTGVSFSDGYGGLVERVGTLTAQARVDSEATTAILKQATDNRDSLSGVSLDEEAANLIKFEQYYNASSQVIQVARSLFDTLMNTFR
ncbi:flagellar hook-associated protein FlgK [Pseudomonas sp. Q1-7]|uniref:flagellar hook-associated protein FlgK n=1 Tax=Pseudomonas sp. Q1-7 TaxID=3020843 RepID=UPI0023012F66|nr:flagellar hook-associated protein FlgK [Pseudomonas sp. Q1-7]